MFSASWTLFFWSNYSSVTRPLNLCSKGSRAMKMESIFHKWESGCSLVLVIFCFHAATISKCSIALNYLLPPSLEHPCVLPVGEKNISIATSSNYDIQILRMVGKNDSLASHKESLVSLRLIYLICHSTLLKLKN